MLVQFIDAASKKAVAVKAPKAVKVTEDEDAPF